METTIIGYFSSDMAFRVLILRLAAYEGSACQGVPHCSVISCWLMSIRDIKSVAPPADVLQKAGSCAAVHLLSHAASLTEPLTSGFVKLSNACSK